MHEKSITQQADDFEHGWRETFAQFRLPFLMTTALLRLASIGERPVEIERLAAAIGRPPEETVALALQWARVRVSDGWINLDPESSPFSRYHLEVGTRVLDTGGCAVDLFWAVLAAGISVRAASTCPATRTTIQVDLSPEGVERAEPPGTVIAVLHPRALVLQEMDNVDDADANACSQQPFFASAEAAVNWLAAHPGGRIYPIAAFFEWFRRNLASASV